MTALAVAGIIASGGLAEIGHVILDLLSWAVTGLYYLALASGSLVMLFLACWAVAYVLTWHTVRRHPLTGVTDPKAEVGDDTLAMLCPCCTSWSDDCICTADCGVPRCQMADPEVSRG